MRQNALVSARANNASIFPSLSLLPPKRRSTAPKSNPFPSPDFLLFFSFALPPALFRPLQIAKERKKKAVQMSHRAPKPINKAVSHSAEKWTQPWTDRASVFGQGSKKSWTKLFARGALPTDNHWAGFSKRWCGSDERPQTQMTHDRVPCALKVQVLKNPRLLLAHMHISFSPHMQRGSG